MQPKSAGWPAPLTASTFNWLGKYANSPGNRGHCYTEIVYIVHANWWNVEGDLRPIVWMPLKSTLSWVHSTDWVFSNPHSNKFRCMKQTRSQFESAYLSENLSDLFQKRFLLVHDDIICKYKHGSDSDIVRDVEVISHIQWIRRKEQQICSG